MVKDGEKYLITTNNWFYGPDGESYRAAWGTCKLRRMEDVFGFTPSRPSTNWYLEVGSPDKYVIIAGCQIHYAVRLEEKPKSNHFNKFYTDKDTGMTLNEDRIYYAE